MDTRDEELQRIFLRSAERAMAIFAEIDAQTDRDCVAVHRDALRQLISEHALICGYALGALRARSERGES